MAAIAELYASRATTTGANPAATLMYMVSGTTSEPEVRSVLLAEVPSCYEVQQLQLRSTSQRHMGNGIWQCQANYGFNENRTNFNPNLGGQGDGGGGGGGGGESGDGNQPGPNDPIGPHIRISIGAERRHITQSLRTVGVSKRVNDPNDSPSFNGAIGATRDGSVAGTDIIVPNVTWTETWTFKNVYVTWNYIDTLDSLVGRVNGYPFRNRPAGEVMFLGAEIDPMGFEGTKIVYSFHREKNITRDPANELTGFRLIKDGPDRFDPVEKQGHHLAWVLYEQRRSPDNKNMVTVPLALYIEEVGRDSDGSSINGFFNHRDFGVIGIGDPGPPSEE